MEAQVFFSFSLSHRRPTHFGDKVVGRLLYKLSSFPRRFLVLDVNRFYLVRLSALMPRPGILRRAYHPCSSSWRLLVFPLGIEDPCDLVWLLQRARGLQSI